MNNLTIGDVVRLQTCKEYPIGGWLHGELAVVCGGSYSSQTIVVKLKNKVLRDSVQQEGTLRGTAIVNFANVQKQ